MEAYIDLSYIFHLLLCVSSTRLTKIITGIKVDRKRLFLLEISSVVLYINVLLYGSSSSYLYLVYYGIFFFLFFRKYFIKLFFSFLFSYYSQISIMRIFTNDLYLYRGVLMIYRPIGFIYVLGCPLILLLIEIITRSIKSLILLKKYRYIVKLTIRDKVYDTSAYFDSGNTLKYKDLPVVFLTEELKDKNVSYERILVEGIGKETGEYLKGKILFENKEKDVYFAYVKKKSFNGCSCLLNVYLLG